MSGSRHGPWTALVPTAVAVVFMLGGATMLFIDVSKGIAFPLITIGIALVMINQATKHHPKSHQ